MLKKELLLNNLFMANINDLKVWSYIDVGWFPTLNVNIEWFQGSVADVASLPTTWNTAWDVISVKSPVGLYQWSWTAWIIITLNDVLVYKWVLSGSWNPNYPAWDAGNTYIISVPWKIWWSSWKVVLAWDMLICNTDWTSAWTEAQVWTYWNLISKWWMTIWDMFKADNLSWLADYTTARQNLWLEIGVDVLAQRSFWDIVDSDIADFATSAQWWLADTALQSWDIWVNVLAQRTFGDIVDSDIADFAPALTGDQNYMSDAQISALHWVNDVNTSAVPISQNTLIKDPTWFDIPENVVINYDPTDQTITLTGTWKAYWLGVEIPTFTTGWKSAWHTDTTGHIYFLYYDGTFKWATDSFPWFDKVLIAWVNYGATNKYAVRESHWVKQDPDTHGNLHYTVGTYKLSWWWIPSASYTLASTNDWDRRPNIDETYIMDEDLLTINPPLTSKSYTQYRLWNASAWTYSLASGDIISLNWSVPYYNTFSTPNWGQTAMPINSIATVWIYTVPVTASTGSQAYRYLFVQPQWITQATSGSSWNLATALNSELLRTPAELNLWSLRDEAPELVCIGRIAVTYTNSNWSLRSVQNVTWNKFSQIGSPSWNYLTIVETDSTLTGAGTGASPLSVVSQVSNTAYGSSWLNITSEAPSKSAVYNKVETIIPVKTMFETFIWSTLYVAPPIPLWVTTMVNTYKNSTYMTDWPANIPSTITTMAWVFSWCTMIKNVPNIPDSVNDICWLFANCANLVNAPTIWNWVTDMSLVFVACSRLVNAPVISNNVTTMHWTFQWCTNLVNAPTLPDSLLIMSWTFSSCSNLVNAPTIPNNVTDVSSAFFMCVNLVDAPALPWNINHMTWTFAMCSKLTNVPTIPDSVTTMLQTFKMCTNLINAPAIWANVSYMVWTFDACTNLAWDITITNANVTNFATCFQNCNWWIAKTLRCPAWSASYTLAMTQCNWYNGVTVVEY